MVRKAGTVSVRGEHDPPGPWMRLLSVCTCVVFSACSARVAPHEPSADIGSSQRAIINEGDDPFDDAHLRLNVMDLARVPDNNWVQQVVGDGTRWVNLTTSEYQAHLHREAWKRAYSVLSPDHTFDFDRAIREKHVNEGFTGFVGSIADFGGNVLVGGLTAATGGNLWVGAGAATVKTYLSNGLKERAQEFNQAPVKNRVEAWLAFYDKVLPDGDPLKVAHLRTHVVEKMLTEFETVREEVSPGQRDEVMLYLIGEVNESVQEATYRTMKLDESVKRLESITVTKEQLQQLHGSIVDTFEDLRQEIADLRAGRQASPEAADALRGMRELGAEFQAQTTQQLKKVGGKVQQITDKLPEDGPGTTAQHDTARRELSNMFDDMGPAVEELSMAGQGIAMLLSPFDPGLAKRVDTVARGTQQLFQAAKAMHAAFSGAEVAMAAGLMASGGFLVAGMSVMSALGGSMGGGSGPDPATMAALQQISRQIADLERMVRVNFDKVHARLGEIGADVETVKLELRAMREEMRENFDRVERNQSILLSQSMQLLESLATLDESMAVLHAELVLGDYQDVRLTVRDWWHSRSRPMTVQELEDARDGLYTRLDQFLTGRLLRVDDLNGGDRRPGGAAGWNRILRRPEGAPLAAATVRTAASLRGRNELPASTYAYPPMERALPALMWAAGQYSPTSGELPADPSEMRPPTLWKDGAATLNYLLMSQYEALDASSIRRTGLLDFAEQGFALLRASVQLQGHEELWAALGQEYEAARTRLHADLQEAVAFEVNELWRVKMAPSGRSVLRASFPDAHSTERDRLVDTLWGGMGRPDPQLRYSNVPAVGEKRDMHRYFGPVEAGDDTQLLARAMQAGLVRLGGTFRTNMPGNNCRMRRECEPQPGGRPFCVEFRVCDNYWIVANTVVALEALHPSAAEAEGPVGEGRFALVHDSGDAKSPLPFHEPYLRDFAQSVGTLGGDAWPAGSTVPWQGRDGQPGLLEVVHPDTLQTQAALNVVNVVLSPGQRAVLQRLVGERDHTVQRMALSVVNAAAELKADEAYVRAVLDSEAEMTAAIRKLASYLALAYPLSSGAGPESTMARAVLGDDSPTEGPIYRRTQLGPSVLDAENLQAIRDAVDATAAALDAPQLTTAPQAERGTWSVIEPALDEAVSEARLSAARVAEWKELVDWAALEHRAVHGPMPGQARASLIRYQIQFWREAGFELDEELATHVELLASFVGADTLYGTKARWRALCLAPKPVGNPLCAPRDFNAWEGIADHTDCGELELGDSCTRTAQQGSTRVARHVGRIATLVDPVERFLDFESWSEAADVLDRTLGFGVPEANPKGAPVQPLEVRGAGATTTALSRLTVMEPERRIELATEFDVDDHVVPASERAVVRFTPCEDATPHCGDEMGWLVEMELRTEGGPPPGAWLERRLLPGIAPALPDLPDLPVLPEWPPHPEPEPEPTPCFELLCDIDIDDLLRPPPPPRPWDPPWDRPGRPRRPEWP